MDLLDLLDRRCVTLKAGASSKHQALSLVAETAARRFGLDAGAVLDALATREALGSTGVGNGVAVPHAKAPGLDKVRAVFVSLDRPVDFDAVDGAPVDILFALFSPEAAGPEHLQAFARVARLLRKSELRQQLRHARTVDAVYALLSDTAPPSAA
jgi:PTS system nitrogen regulatory IIA component